MSSDGGMLSMLDLEPLRTLDVASFEDRKDDEEEEDDFTRELEDEDDDDDEAGRLEEEYEDLPKLSDDNRL